MKKLNANQIKSVMVLLMTLDSLRCFLPPNLAVLYNILSKIAVAWFAFGAAEGVRYTSNLKNYNCRLYLAAAVMFIGNIVLNTGFGMEQEPLSENAFLTIALGVSALSAFERMNRTSRGMNLSRILAGISLAILGAICQYGYIMIPVMLCSFYLNHKPEKRDYALIAISMLLLILDIAAGGPAAETTSRILTNGSFLYVLVIPFIHMYSGKRGSQSPAIKYFFYIYYPAHIWLIHIIVNLTA